MATPVQVSIRRVKNIKPEFQEIIDQYTKKTGRPLRGFVFRKLSKIGQIAQCKCQCSMTFSCGGGGGGGGGRGN